MSETPFVPLDNNGLALERTRLAYERTLMAWIRTSTALVSFGFTMYKFFQYMVTEGLANKIPQRLGPRQFAIMMILLGMFGLFASVIQQRYNMKNLRRSYPHMPRSLAEGVGVLLFVFSLLLLLAVIYKQ